MEARRIRLKFENPSILTRKQRAEGVHRCWYFLQRNVHSVADLAVDIVSSFQLQQACPHGVSLAMEKFALLPYQPIYLLKDEDVLSVKERVGKKGLFPALNLKDIGGKKIEELETTPETSYPQDENVDLCAFEELRGCKGEGARLDLSIGNENGKFARLKHRPRKTPEEWSESSEEEHGDKTLRHISCQDTFSKKAKHGPGESLRASLKSFHESSSNGDVKKLPPNANEGETAWVENPRKRKSRVDKSAFEKCKELGPLQQIEHIKVSKHKNKHAEDWGRINKTNGKSEHQRESAQPSLEVEDLPKRKKKKREKRALDEEKMEEAKYLEGDKRKTKRNKNKDASEVMAGGNTSPKHQDDTREPEANVNKAGKVETNVVGCNEKLPSRSARRKKAKRQWLRKQMEGKNELEHGKLEERPKQTPFSQLMQNGKFDNYLATDGEKRIQDVEAVREAQPMLVAPGHIRFEPIDSDEGSEQTRTPMPEFHFSNGIKTKKQGRCWGKEIMDKNCHKDIKKTSTGSDVLEVVDAQMPSIHDERIKINFEELPTLAHFPEEGDVLAYRLVELTINWTPMLSPYRVGRVISYSKGSNILKLDPVQGYPLTWKPDTADVCSDTNVEEEESPCAPYNEDGSLEIELPSLSDVRIVEKKDSGNSATRAEDVKSHHEESNNQLLGTMNHQKANDLIFTPGFEGQPLHGGGNMSSMWKELSAELDKKKMQLFQIDSSKDHSLTDKGDCLTNKIEPTSEDSQKSPAEVPCKHPEAKNQQSEKGRDQKSYSKFLKSGALGPTIALLRTQHVL